MVKKIISAVIGTLIASIIYGSLLMGIPKIETRVIKNIKPEVELSSQIIAIKIPQQYQLTAWDINNYKANKTVIYFRKNPMWFWEKPKPKPQPVVEVVEAKEGGVEKDTSSNDTLKPNSNPISKELLEKAKDTVRVDTVLPLDIKYIKSVTSQYGSRKDPFTKTSAFHTGIDYSYENIEGKPISSIMEGRVKEITRNNKNGPNEDYGNLVVVEYEGFTAYYGHMKDIEEGLKVGSTVRAGDTLGYVGNTGRSTGSHLHFELRINNTPIDPNPILNKIIANITGTKEIEKEEDVNEEG